jgi:hypothetical protein
MTPSDVQGSIPTPPVALLHISDFHFRDANHPVLERAAAGGHVLSLGAGTGAQFDALLVLPQTDVMDRAAMNLFQNWNFAPWENPF